MIKLAEIEDATGAKEVIYDKPPAPSMRIADKTKVKIGMWATRCCHRDLYQIKTESALREIVAEWGSYMKANVDVWPTKKEALLEIRTWWDDEKEIRCIDKMLADLEEI